MQLQIEIKRQINVFKQIKSLLRLTQQGASLHLIYDSKSAAALGGCWQSNGDLVAPKIATF